MPRHKYSNEFKIKLAKLYFNQHKSFNYLNKKYHVNLLLLSYWIDSAEIWGLSILKTKSSNRRFSINFKLKVVKYYLNHNDGLVKVGARFRVSYTHVWRWTKKFQNHGFIALRNHYRETFDHHRKKHKPIKNNRNKSDFYKNEIARLRAKNRSLQLDRIILKAIARMK